MKQLTDWARYYYIGVLGHQHDPKHFWFEAKLYRTTVTFESKDGHMYAFFYADPKDRMGGWKCWIPFHLFILDEYGD